MDARLRDEDELKARHRVVTTAGTSGAAIAYDYKPCQPLAMREIPLNGRRDVRCVLRRDALAYVGIHDGGIVVLDTSEPRTPPILGGINMPGTDLTSFAIAGTTLYAADATHGFHALDISNPRRPRHLAKHAALAHTGNHRVLVSGATLVLVNDHAFSVFDVSTPAQPRPLAVQHRMRTAVGWLRGAALVGTTLHVTQGGVGLWTFDLAAPAKPRAVAGQEIRLDARPTERLITESLAVLGDRLFVGTSSGIWCLHATGDGAPTTEAFFTGPGTIRAGHGEARDGKLYFCAFESHDHILHIFEAAPGVRYLGRQRLSRMLDRIHDFALGDVAIAAAGTGGVLLATL